MSLDYSYKDIEWCQSLFHKSDECFCDGNIIIPDSMDDIAKIISIKAQPSVSESKCEDGRITVSGQVKLNVLYIGENENGKIFTLSVSHPFSHAINAPGVTNEFLPLTTVTSCSLNYTLVNSRRLKTTALIRFCTSSYKNNRLKALTAVSEAEAKTSDKTFTAARCICTKNIVIADTVELGAGKAAITSILKQNAKIADKDFKVLTNKIIVKGNIAASILYCAEDVFSDATVTVPFTEVVEAEGVSPSCNTNVTITVADCSIRPDTDLSGEYKMLDVNIVLSVAITAFASENISTVTDVYLPGGALKTISNPLRLQNGTTECIEEEFLKENITLSSGAPAIGRILDIDCRIGELNNSDGSVAGNAEVTFMYLSPASSSINTYTAKIPLAHKFNQNSILSSRGEVNHIGYAITGDDTLEVRLSVLFITLTNEEENINIISDCSEAEYIPTKRPSVIVSFVNKGDTLWDIAKKHNIAVSHLASANAMDENSVLTVGEKLIIPR